MFAKLFTPILGLAACLLAQKIIPYEPPVTYISPDSLGSETLTVIHPDESPTIPPPGKIVEEYYLWKCCLSEASGPYLLTRDKKPEEYWKFPGYKQEDLFCCFIDSALKNYEIWATEYRILEKQIEQDRRMQKKMVRTYCVL